MSGLTRWGKRSDFGKAGSLAARLSLGLHRIAHARLPRAGCASGIAHRHGHRAMRSWSGLQPDRRGHRLATAAAAVRKDLAGYVTEWACQLRDREPGMQPNR